MITTFDKKNDISTNQLFHGLNHNDLIQIYNIGKIIKYSPGDILFQEGDENQTLFLILQGSIKIIKTLQGQEKEVAVLHKDDCLGDIAFMNSSVRTASAVVSEPSTIMIIDNLSMGMLTPKIQLTIYKNFNRIASGKIDELIWKETDLVNKNKYLGTKIKNFLHTQKNEYIQSEIVQNILKNIPRLPMYTSKLLLLLLDENISTRKVADQAKLDPSLVGVMLKTVNSSYYGLQNKISDVQQAILLLGFNQVYQLVLSNGIKSTMPDTPEFQELQHHSIIVSILAFEIARLSNLDKAVMLSTVGLLHDIGKSVILLLKQQHQNLTMLIDLLDYATIGSLLLEEWNIPDVVCKSLEYQFFPEFYPPSEIPEEYRKNVAVLFIAHLCYEYFKREEGCELPAAFLDEYIRLLNLTETSFSELVKNKIVPVLDNKIDSYPEDVKKFFKECKQKITNNDSANPNEVNINHLTLK